MNDEQAVKDLVMTWLTATEKGDHERVLNLMAEDVVFLVSGRAPMHKSEFAAGLVGLESFHLRMTSDIQEVKVFGDWAYCWNRLSVLIEPKDGGAPINRAGDVLSVLQKQVGSWVIVRDANLLSVVSS